MHVQMGCRGCGDTKLTSPMPFHQPADTKDIFLAIRTLRKAFPEAAVFAAGFSLGAYTLNKYLGEADSGVFSTGVCTHNICQAEPAAEGLSRTHTGMGRMLAMISTWAVRTLCCLHVQHDRTKKGCFLQQACASSTVTLCSAAADTCSTA